MPIDFCTTDSFFKVCKELKDSKEISQTQVDEAIKSLKYVFKEQPKLLHKLNNYWAELLRSSSPEAENFLRLFLLNKIDALRLDQLLYLYSFNIISYIAKEKVYQAVLNERPSISLVIHFVYSSNSTLAQECINLILEDNMQLLLTKGLLTQKHMAEIFSYFNANNIKLFFDIFNSPSFAASLIEHDSKNSIQELINSIKLLPAYSSEISENLREYAEDNLEFDDFNKIFTEYVNSGAYFENLFTKMQGVLINCYVLRPEEATIELLSKNIEACYHFLTKQQITPKKNRGLDFRGCYEDLGFLRKKLGMNTRTSAPYTLDELEEERSVVQATP